MSEMMRESLSAMLDNEANELEMRRLLAGIDEDEPLRQTWARYNLVRGVIKGGELAYTQVDLSRRISEQLATEGEGATGEPGRLQRMLRPVASFAVAASVAAVVVVGGQQFADTDTAAGNTATVAASASPVGMLNSLGATPIQASYGTQSVPVLQPATRTAYQELARQRMGRYVQVHAEHAALNSPQGLIPFARVPEIRE